MATNDFLAFCPTSTGTNLLTQAEYLADAQLAIGNQPGVGRSKLVNKALRQATFVAAMVAKYISDFTGDDVLDDENATNFQATMSKALKIPSGIVVDTAGTAAPTGWLLCYGQSLLRADYPDLFTAIGTTYGSADGTHFNLPDCRGRVKAGKDNMGGAAASRLTATYFGTSASVLGAVGGLESHTLTTAQLASHAHNFLPAAHHVQLLDLDTGGGSGYGAATAAFTSVTATQVAGSDGAHNNVQPTIIFNTIIKT